MNKIPGSSMLYHSVEYGNYDLIKGDDVVILPQFWENTVIPGSTVTMRERTSAEEKVPEKKVPWFERVVDSIRER